MNKQLMKCGCPEGSHRPSWPGVHAPAGMLEALITPEMRRASAAAERRYRRGRLAAMRREQLAKHFAKRAAA